RLQSAKSRRQFSITPIIPNSPREESSQVQTIPTEGTGQLGSGLGSSQIVLAFCDHSAKIFIRYSTHRGCAERAGSGSSSRLFSNPQLQCPPRKTNSACSWKHARRETRTRLPSSFDFTCLTSGRRFGESLRQFFGGGSIRSILPKKSGIR